MDEEAAAAILLAAQVAGVLHWPLSGAGCLRSGNRLASRDSTSWGCRLHASPGTSGMLQGDAAQPCSRCMLGWPAGQKQPP